MDIKIIQECFQRSHAGTITFPEVVKILGRDGVQRYHVDLIQFQKTVYSKNDEIYTEKFSLDWKPEQKKFNQAGITQALKEVQAGKINYLQFLKAIMDNGIVGYWVFIDGGQTIYYSRTGEQHVEHFAFAASTT